MESLPPKDLSYFQSNRPDVAEDDPLGTRAFFFATETLDDPTDIGTFLAEFVAWRLKQKPAPTKNDLRILITDTTRELSRQITISFGQSSTQKTLADVWRDAMNTHSFLRL